MAGRVQMDRCGSRRRGDNRLSLARPGRMWPPNRSSHMAKKLPPVHPGEILREEFLVPLKLTPYAVAAALNVPRTRIERIARGEAGHRRHRAAARRILQDRRRVLDEHAGALRSRNGRRLARAADQEDCVLRAGVRAIQIARTGCLVAYSLISDATVQGLVLTARYPSAANAFSAATFAASG